MRKLYVTAALITAIGATNIQWGNNKRDLIKEIIEHEQFKDLGHFIAYSEERKKMKEEQAVKDAEFNITTQRINERRFNAAFVGCCVGGSCATLYKHCFSRQHKGFVGATVLTGALAGVTFSAYKTSNYRKFLQKHYFRKMD